MTIQNKALLLSDSKNLENAYPATFMKRTQLLLLLTGACLCSFFSASTALSKVAVPLFKPEKFIFISGSEFTMGSPETEAGRLIDEIQHQVKVNDFYLSKYAVTVAEFKRFMAESSYRTDAEKAMNCWIWNGGDQKKTGKISWRYRESGKVRPKSEKNLPVVHMSWNDANEYCRWLSKKTGKNFRLPTEAEWEYASGAGDRTVFHSGESLSANRTKAVAVESVVPNAWGLYGMHSNAWEWCSDIYSGIYYYECKAVSLVENPGGPAPETDSSRVIRGGCYNSAEVCRSAYRSSSIPDNWYSDFSFRLVLVP